MKSGLVRPSRVRLAIFLVVAGLLTVFLDLSRALELPVVTRSVGLLCLGAALLMDHWLPNIPIIAKIFGFVGFAVLFAPLCLILFSSLLR